MKTTKRPSQIGLKHGKLEAKSEPFLKNGKGRSYITCKCDCGNIKDIEFFKWESEHTKSCGCGRKYVKHGCSYERIWNTWIRMNYRCLDLNQKDYGGRGIKVCEEWSDSNLGFINFKDWAIKNGYSDDLSIERKNVNGNYCPENCCWIPFKDQIENRRMSYRITYDGKTQTAEKWAKEFGLTGDNIRRRIRDGMDGTNALFEVLNNKNKSRKDQLYLNEKQKFR